MTKSRIKMADGSEFTAFYLKPPVAKANDKMPNNAGKMFELNKSEIGQSILYKLIFNNNSNKNNWDI